MTTKTTPPTTLAPILDWDQINTVLLDMDGTLLDLHFDNHFWQHYVLQRYAEANQLTLAQASEHLIPHFTAKLGQLDWYCVDYWTQHLKLDIAQLKYEIADLIAVRPFVVSFLEALRQHNKRVVLVTNAHPKSLHLKMQRTALDHHFDALICSHQFGYPKEHAQFWALLQQHEPFNAAQTLLIDDSIPILKAAASYGIRWLLGIQQPDSKQPPKTDGEFTLLASFNDIMP